MVTNRFVLPKEKIESPSLLVCGNFMARRSSGFNNMNRTSWSVFRVEWIIGEFEEGCNDEVDLVSKISVLEQYESNWVGYLQDSCFMQSKSLGVMNKSAARKMISGEHEKSGRVVAWSQSKEHNPVKEIY